ncbi:hypothetical protein CCP3SC1AL1_2030004 [Gammaproteobacteria bacterium]
MSKIGTLIHKNTRGIKNINGPHLDTDGKPFEPVQMDCMELAEAIHTHHKTDKFFTCYTVGGLNNWPRLSKQSLASVEELVPVTMSCFAFDWDVPEHKPWTVEAFADFFALFDNLTDPHLKSWRYAYTSRHGARVVYTLSTPVSTKDGEQYIATLYTKFKDAGLHMDENCKDWTRLFRCPNVVRDGIDTSTEEFYLYNEQDTDLSLTGLHKSTTKVIPTIKSYDNLRTGQPTQDDVDAILFEPGSQGREKQSEFIKAAKAILKHCSFYESLFKDGIPLAGRGNRNDAIMKSTGTAIPLIIKRMNYATPVHVYALFYNTVLEMEQDQDWLGHLWNAILSIWPVEIEKFNQLSIEKAKEEEEAIREREKIAKGMSMWCDNPALLEDDTRDLFVERHLLANFGKFFYPVMPDGGYSPHCISKDQLISHIRTTPHLSKIIQTSETGQMGKLVDVPDRALHNRYAIPVNEVIYVPQPSRGGHIEGNIEGCRTLKLPMYRRNPRLVPAYSECVDEWLAAMFAGNYERAVDWLANALAFEEGCICALSITAPPGIGKKLLVEGLAECLENPMFATGKDVSSDFNGTMGKTPFLAINEEWPKKNGESSQEQFKSMTGGDKQRIRDLYKPAALVSNPMRLIMTANNHDIIRTLLDKDMTPSDREAVGQRLLHFDLDGEAAAWLEARGGNAFTGKAGARWIAGSPVPSNFIVAKHFLHLHAMRIKQEGGFSGRFLVEGNCSKNSSFMIHQIVQKDTTAAVITAMTNLIEAKCARKSYTLDDSTGAVYVTINSILDELKVSDMPMTYGKVSQVIRTVTVTQNPVLFNYLEHHQIDCETLLIHASRAGRETPELRKLVEFQRKKKKNKI